MVMREFKVFNLHFEKVDQPQRQGYSGIYIQRKHAQSLFWGKKIYSANIMEERGVIYRYVKTHGR